MKSISKIPRGVRYFYGEEVKKRRYVERLILSVFEGWSYEEIILPIFDYHSLFALGIGQDKAEHTYRFLDSDGELLALRPDLTSLVARTVATRFATSNRPIRLCYNGEVFRYKEAQEQRPHDFHQLGLEHIGNDRLEADLEVLLVAIEALSALGLSDFIITLGHVNFFNGIVEYLGLNQHLIEEFRLLVDSKNQSKLSYFLGEKLPKTQAKELCELFRNTGGSAFLEKAKNFATYNQTLTNALADLTGIFEIAQSLDITKYLTIDLGDVNGLDYYTAMTFKIYVDKVGAAIASGGRYDSLLKNFGVEDPAVGFQISLDLIANIIEKPTNSIIEKKHLSASQNLVEMFQQAKELRKNNTQIEIVDQII
ncbi:MAG: ATP phosphoribosyltransferase regulatory subunit [Acidobacteria bacterium]|nr:ATP phosphoribosyltransferase regulatory subunit [Acidobacteriota bacterium]